MLPMQLSCRKLSGERSASSDRFCTLRSRVNVQSILYTYSFLYPLSSCMVNSNLILFAVFPGT